jgi:hypothetical protein
MSSLRIRQLAFDARFPAAFAFYAFYAFYPATSPGHASD